MYYTRNVAPTTGDTAYNPGDIWKDSVTGREWRYVGAGVWEPWGTLQGEPVDGRRLVPGLDGSDVGLADAPSSDGDYVLRNAAGVKSWAAAPEGLPDPDDGEEGDVLAIVNGAWAPAAPSGGGLWSGDVSGNGIATDVYTEGAGVPLTRSGSPATFEVTIPTEQIAVGAVFEIYAAATLGSGSGSLQILPVSTGGIFASNNAWGVFGRVTIIAAGVSGSVVREGMGLFSPTQLDVDLSSGLALELAGSTGLGESLITGLRLHVKRVA